MFSVPIIDISAWPDGDDTVRAHIAAAVAKACSDMGFMQVTGHGIVDGPSRRRSVAFFHDGNYDALVEVLPTCVSEDRPARYAPVLAGQHLLNKLLGPRTLSMSTSTIDTVGDRASALG